MTSVQHPLLAKRNIESDLIFKEVDRYYSLYTYDYGHKVNERELRALGWKINTDFKGVNTLISVSYDGTQYCLGDTINPTEKRVLAGCGRTIEGTLANFADDIARMGIAVKPIMLIAYAGPDFREFVLLATAAFKQGWDSL